ncbi:MAG: hypothetical protein GX935_04360 [Erysipelotrichia bacterium]|nr:hypothetical protein [Erysipelotrichia bacterium]
MKNVYKYFSLIFILIFILNGCGFIKKVDENPVDPNYEKGLTQQQLFSYLNKPIGYRENKVDNYIYFSFYQDHRVEYSFSNEEIKYVGNVIEFKYNGKNHFEVSCQFDPEDNQNFTSFVKTFDIFFEELDLNNIEISFDGNTYKLMNDTGYDYSDLLLSLQLHKNYYVDFNDVILFVKFDDGNKFSYDNGLKIISGFVDNVTYMGNDVYDLNVRIIDGEKQYHQTFLITHSKEYPEKIFIELDDYGLVEMRADKGYDTVEILSILTNASPFEEINGKNIRLFDVENFNYIKTNTNGDYLLNGLITLFDYQGKGEYKMTVQFSKTNDEDDEINKYDIEVIFSYDENEKILYIKECDIERMIEEKYTLKAKK